MEREEAIKILADLTDNLFLHTWEEQYKALHMAIEALSERTGEWIPVSEKLPETGGSILVTYSDGEVGIVWSARPKVWGKYEKANNLIFPVAWMPLPEPYKGGDDE